LTYIPSDSRARRVPGLINEETFTQIVLLRLPTDDKQNVLDVIEHLRFAPGVYYAEPNYFVELTSITPNDPRFNELWGMTNIQAPQAWAITTGSRDIRVALIDIGYQSHNDLNANFDFTHAWCFFSNQPLTLSNLGNTLPHAATQIGHHGNHVAGTIGAVGNNNLGVAGVNWQVSIVPFEVFSQMVDNQPRGSSANQLAALTRAIAHDIPVVNMSMGGFNSLRIHIRDNFRGLFVWSGGNSATNRDIDLAFMEIPNNALGVGALAQNNTRASFSCYGARTVQIWAPGQSILSTVLSNGYAMASGTSMASPHVAGVAALMLSINPDLTGEQLKSLILDAAIPVTIQQPATDPGSHLSLRLNAYGAVRAAQALLGEAPPRNLTYQLSGNTVTLNWQAPFITEGLLGYRVYRNNVRLTPNPITALSFTDDNPPNGAHTYAVRAVYANVVSQPVSHVVWVGATSIFSETFDAVTFPPTGWQNIDQDVGSDTWDRWVRQTSVWGITPQQGAGMAASFSWMGSDLYPNNWLITRQIALPADREIKLTYWSRGSGGGWTDNYGIFISTTGTAIGSGTGEIVGDFTRLSHEAVADIWTRNTINLSAFAGENVFIAFRHFNSDDQSGAVFIDNINILTVPMLSDIFEPLPPQNIVATISESVVNLTWDAPPTVEQPPVVVPGWFSHLPTTEMVALAPGNWGMPISEYFIHRYTSEDLHQMGIAGGLLTHIRYGVHGSNAYWVYVFTGGEFGVSLGTQRYMQQTGSAFAADASGWFTRELTTPVLIPTDEELWIAIWFQPNPAGTINTFMRAEGTPNPNANIMHDGNGYWSRLTNYELNANWPIHGLVAEPPSNPGTGSMLAVQGYRVWRLLDGEQNNPNSWTLLANNITTTYFTDNTWNTVEPGTYLYAVKAIYEDDMLSEPAFSNTVIAIVPPVYEITLNQTGTHTFPAATFGYTAQTPLSVSIENIGNQPTGTLTIALSGTNANNFALSRTSVPSIDVAGTNNFTVVPNTGLSVGTYTATVTVTGGNGISENFNVSFTVTPAPPPPPPPVYEITLSQVEPHIFDTVIVDYTTQTPLEITIENIGNQPTGTLNIALSGANASSFALSRTSVPSIDVAGTNNFTVVPNTGLSVGTYTATVTVTGENNISESFDVRFTVTPAPPTSIVVVETGRAPSLQVHPNPFTDEIHIVNAEIGQMLYVLSVSGIVVHTQRITRQNETIQLGHLPAGTYILRVGEQSIRLVKR